MRWTGQIGPKRDHRRAAQRLEGRALLSPRRAFTLIELILVMAMLLIVMAVAAPSLTRFFRGRAIDEEARRLVSLTRYGQSRAVSEGVPMVLWIDPDERRYGLTEEFSYTELDTKAVEYELGRDLSVEVDRSALPARMSAQAAPNPAFGRNVTMLRFLPDGFISETSPVSLWLREGEGPTGARKDAERESIWITQSRNRLHYEVQTNELAYVRR